MKWEGLGGGSKQQEYIEAVLVGREWYRDLQCQEICEAVVQTGLAQLDCWRI